MFIGAFVLILILNNSAVRAFKKRTYYLAFAIGFYVLWFLFKLGGMPDFKQAIPSTAIDVFISVAALYVSVEVLLPRYIYKRRYAKFFLLFLSLVLLCGSIIIFSQLALMGSSVFAYQKNISKYQEHFFYWFWSDLVFGSYILVTFISLGGCFIRLAFDRISSERKVEALEKEKLITELAMLKHQINPHFIFNALNTVYYKIEKSNTAARKILEQFSGLLRYQLYDCNAQSVPIGKEIEFLANFIEVQRGRTGDRVQITIKGFHDVSGFEISPYLLVPIVENCFKHVSDDRQKNNYISIECGAANNWFWFQAQNSSSTREAEGKGGIGLTNVSKRLELLYPGKHVLKIDDSGEDFKVILQLAYS